MRKSCVVFLWFFALFLAGCSDPGSRALLKGERFINEGRPGKAIAHLQTATRLLPRNAQAWNHLGLAFHHQNEFLAARHAYVQALNIDINLAAARYNLGRLLLENHDLPAAIDQLTSYTLLQPRSIDGWLQLATAQLRARRLDAADKSFRSALDVVPNHPEALNGLGNVQYQRRRTQEALTLFNRCLEHDPGYAPAMLNAAIITHQSLNNRPLALQFYRKYLAHDPASPNAAAVAAVADQLEQDLTPATLAHVTTNTPPPPIVVKTNPPAAPAPSPRLAGNAPVLAKAPPAKPSPTPATPAANSAPVKAAPKENPVEVTRLPDEPPIKPAQEVAASPAKSNPVAQPTTKALPRDDEASDRKAQDKRGLLARLNPFSGKPKTNDTDIVVKAAQPPEIPASSFPKYRYQASLRPMAGNRREAERHLAAGVKAQRARNLRQALADYQKAVELDPAYFEAQYNRGLAAYELSLWSDSLRAYEYALAIRPDSADARYNFALALKNAGYIDDAAQQLSQLLKAQPNEARAHLSLANLYAHRLNQPRLARAHFTKVLEIDPRHPQSSEIRFWLASHPL